MDIIDNEGDSGDNGGERRDEMKDKGNEDSKE